ncbi:MAG: DegT/DnrJ/EryC1/StrS family aminotransferase [Desulfotomaculaceae bacterium]|nr:DegT/DnrJ/EryC1/StrS family aminotransferase [Desulfotomaculaceae bacterium]
MSIPLLDLKAQYHTLSKEILAAITDVLASGEYVMGGNVRALENSIAQMCEVKHGIGVASGTDALLLSLIALGIGQGDEVITTPYTFFSTAEVISKVQGTPVFVDIDPRTFNLDVKLVEKKITSRTKAILPVHIFGQTADLDELLELCAKYKLQMVEDACQAIGAHYKGRPAGSLGSTGCFSFYPTKNLGGYGDGGMIVTNDDTLADRLRVLRVHGSRQRYYHTVPGYNSRLDEIQAAVLRVKLKYLAQWNEARRARAALYDQLLKESAIETPHVEAWNESVYHLYVVRSKERDRLKSRLAQAGISSGVYYPLPLHLQEVYKALGYQYGDLPEAERTSCEALALPLYPEMTETKVRQVVKVLLES